jgi:molybdate transport repressor ModE-like protein
MPLGEPVPDPRSLDLLQSVARLGSIRQAALAHGISQPAASMRLRSLERVLALDLLDRSNGRATLTPTGVAVAQWSEDVLGGMRHLLTGAAALRAAGHTHLRIIASMTVAEYLIPGWLSRLRASEPDTVISLQMGNSERVAEVMSRQGADVGFIEGLRASPNLSSRVVQADDLILVVAPTHPWARRRAAVTAGELAATPLVLREHGSGTREILETALHAAGLTLTPMLELGSTTAIKSAVASGIGPGVLSRLATDSDIQQGRLVSVPTEGVSLDRSIRVVWPKGRSLPPLARRLIRPVDEPAGHRRPGHLPSTLP